MCLLKKCFPLLIAVVLAGCGVSPSGVEEKERGYERIISLGPTITQNIYLLGREDLLVGVSSYCARLPEVENVEIAGDLVTPNIEKILVLSPDAVMVTGMISRGAAERMQSLGLNVVFFPEPSNFEEICSQFKELAGLLGEEGKAAGIISSVKEEIQIMREKTAGVPVKSVISQIGAAPLWVSPGNSFINDIIEFAGGTNLGPEEGGMVSVEAVIRKNPEIILVIDMGIAREQARMWKNYPSVEAVKKNEIHIVDSFVFCSPTPESFLEAVRTAAGIFHGE